MIKKVQYFFIIIISILFLSCENTEIVSPEAAHDEYTVVRAELKSGRAFNGASFTKTLPLGIPYDIKSAELKNVTAYIKIDSTQVIPLHYLKDGIYMPKYELIIEAGRTYELFAMTNNKTIYSKTIVPLEPEVTSISYNPNEFYYLLNLNPKENEVYGAVWIISEAPPKISNDFFSIAGTENTSENFPIRTPIVPQEYRGNEYQGRRFVKAYAFDKAYEEFFKSKETGKPIEDAFTQGGGNIKWNVQGEKVIGLFMGVSEGQTIVP